MDKSLRMDKHRIHKSEKILNLTLEIICLLTGEDYTVVKKCQEPVKQRRKHPRAAKKLSKTQSPITVSPPHSLIHERDNDQKILELTNKIIQLLTGEEEQYIEEQEELFEETVETCQPLTILDEASKRDTPERCPRSPYTQDCTEENPRTPQEDQDDDLPVNVDDTEGEEEEPLTILKLEDIEEEEEMYVGDDQQCEEEIPTAISTDEHNTRNASEEALAPDCEVEGNDITLDPTEDSPTTPIIDPLRHSADTVSDPDYHMGYSLNDADIDTYIRALGVEYLFPSSVDGNCFTQSTSLSTYLSAETGEEPFPRSGRKKYTRDKSKAVPRKRQPPGEKTVPCLECGKCFNRQSHLVVHLRLHTGERPFACSVCEKSFAYKSALVTHERFHSGERPYACSECGKCFGSISQRNVHQRVHTGEKPFLCAECGKCFGSMSQRNVHQRVHTGEKPFLCTQCGKCFAQKYTLVGHQRTHTGEKLFSCAECGIHFGSKGQLTEHERSHTGERPFPCAECGKRFAYRQLLTAHVRKHTGEKPFVCTVCGKSLVNKSNLIAHQKLHTRKK